MPPLSRVAPPKTAELQELTWWQAFKRQWLRSNYYSRMRLIGFIGAGAGLPVVAVSLLLMGPYHHGLLGWLLGVPVGAALTLRAWAYERWWWAGLGWLIVMVAAIALWII